MFAQGEKSNRNGSTVSGRESRAVAHLSAQQHRDANQAVAFVNNRPEALVQGNLQRMIAANEGLPRLQYPALPGRAVQFKQRHQAARVGSSLAAAVVQRCTEDEKNSLHERWEQTELKLDQLYELDHEATLPIADRLEEIRSMLYQDAVAIDRGVLENKIQWVEDWANATPEDVLWDAYLDAYDERMKPRYVKGPVWWNWLQAFHNLEAELYSAKEHGGGIAYKSQRLQRFYSQLMRLGLTPPPEVPDQTEGIVNTLLGAANVRFHAFSGNLMLNRGAWAGSASHGAQPLDYVQTGTKILHAMLERSREGGGCIGGSWWIMRSDSAPSGYALHRGGIDDRGDFIYHL